MQYAGQSTFFCPFEIFKFRKQDNKLAKINQYPVPRNIPRVEDFCISGQYKNEKDTITHIIKNIQCVNMYALIDGVDIKASLKFLLHSSNCIISAKKSLFVNLTKSFSISGQAGVVLWGCLHDHEIGRADFKKQK